MRTEIIIGIEMLIIIICLMIIYKMYKKIYKIERESEEKG